MKLIDADKLHYIKVIILHQTKEEATGKQDVVVFAKEIDKAPTVDAEPVVHGHWVVDEDAWHRDEDLGITDACIEATCSRCGGLGQSNFPNCPWCRAKMDESGEQDD